MKRLYAHLPAFYKKTEDSVQYAVVCTLGKEYTYKDEKIEELHKIIYPNVSYGSEVVGKLFISGLPISGFLPYHIAGITSNDHTLRIWKKVDNAVFFNPFNLFLQLDEGELITLVEDGLYELKNTEGSIFCEINIAKLPQPESTETYKEFKLVFDDWETPDWLDRAWNWHGFERLANEEDDVFKTRALSDIRAGSQTRKALDRAIQKVSTSHSYAVIEPVDDLDNDWLLGQTFIGEGGYLHEKRERGYLVILAWNLNLENYSAMIEAIDKNLNEIRASGVTIKHRSSLMGGNP